ncbi:MAG: hypothetical protein IJ970_00350, partial [Mycoplasmataceae bacterium]|nr:hypothetical protein [Mycoplasmataceae bacterium]
GLLSLSPIALVTTISCTSNPSGETILNKHIGIFDIKKNNNSKLSDVLASSINSESELRKHFLFVNYDPSNFKYNFTFSVDSSDQTKLNVIVTISNSGVEKTKKFTFGGFKKPTDPNDILDSVISSFNLVKKADISNILASSITTEEELTKYFLLDGKYQEYNYEFKNANVVNKNDLKVTYIITKKDNSMLSGEKEIILYGFKKTEVVEEVLKNAVSQFNIVLKSNKTVSGVNASSINSESELLKYFNLVGQNGEEGFSYSFIEAKPSGNLSSKLDVTYEISFHGIKETKHITLEGFNPTSPNNSQEETYNWQEKEDKYTDSLAYYLDPNNSTTDGLDPNQLNATLLSELRNKIHRQTGEDGKDESGQNIYAWEITLPKKPEGASSSSDNNDAVIFTETNHTFTKTYGTTKWKFEVYTVTVTENTTVTINFTNKKTFKELGYKTDFIIDFAYGKKEESETQDQQNLSETRQKYQNTKLEVTNKK